jgi:hypothetical protein
LVGANPPPALADDQLLEWVTVKSKEKTRYLLLVAYIATLVTFLAISSMAVFILVQRSHSGSGAQEELRIRDKEAAAFQLGQSKLIYTQLQEVLRYRLEEKADPDWVNNPGIQALKTRMTEMLKSNRQLYCVLEEHPCSVTDNTTWSEIFWKLSTMLRRQYVGRIQNAYHVGQLVGVFRIETTTKPAGGDMDNPVLTAFASDAAGIWVGSEILLPDNAELRRSVRELYGYVERNKSPSRPDFERIAQPILSYYQDKN